MTDVNRRIAAEPTKDLFIHMLTRDVPVRRAILDLVDNSIDAAYVQKSFGRSLTEMVVEIEFSADHFEITDNCGGIDVDDARNYAFRFGRPHSAAQGPSDTIGQFGVGMKRTLFKLGGEFRVESTTSRSRFVVEQAVESWRQKEEWEFTFGELIEDESQSPESVGTHIRVTEVDPGIGKQLEKPAFTASLIQEIKAAHCLAIRDGITITVNANKVPQLRLELLDAPEGVRPSFVTRTFERDSEHPIECKVYCGVAQRSWDEGGWYIFCNRRLVMAADTSYLTGWGEHYPKYHSDFAFFRGYAFLRCEDTTKLPWTTTKTDVDYDSEIYRRVLALMSSQAKPVITFLRNLERERKDGQENTYEDVGQPLHSAIDESAPVSLDEIDNERVFAAPTYRRPRKSNPNLGHILYKKPKDVIELVKERLGASTNAEAGSMTFDYFVESELED